MELELRDVRQKKKGVGGSNGRGCSLQVKKTFFQRKIDASEGAFPEN
jgi:hypothetical protein